jgi:hypothetical protein
MPLLWGDRICGRVTLRRQDTWLRVENLECDPGTPPEIPDLAITKIAHWTGSTRTDHQESGSANAG